MGAKWNSTRHCMNLAMDSCSAVSRENSPSSRPKMKSSFAAKIGRLLLHAESEACSRADFLHVDFLEPDTLKAGAFKGPETDA